MKMMLFGNPRASRRDPRPMEDSASESERPSGEKLDKLYVQILEELAIPQAKRALMIKNESEEKKWQLILAHSAMKKSESSPAAGKDTRKDPNYWVELISRRNRKNEPVLSISEAGELYAVLRTAHKHFLIEFIDHDGVEALIELTRWYTSHEMRDDERKVLPQIMSTYKALMNNNLGMEGVLNIPDSITSFALGMDLTNETDLNTAQEVIMLLAVTCFYSPEGREMVVNAMEDLRGRWRERQRFQTLVDTFANCDDNGFRAATSMFITTIVNSASEVEDRVRVRNDFLALDIMRVFERVLDEAKEQDDESFSTIATQYQVFEDMMAEDHREVMFKQLAGMGDDDEDDLDLSDQDDIFKYLTKAARSAGCSDLLLELSQALLLIPTERVMAEPTWRAVTQFVREATDYSKRSGGVKRVRLNYQLLSELLDKRQEIDAKISQVSSGDDIIGQQRKKIKDLQRKVAALRKGAKDGAGQVDSSTSRTARSSSSTSEDDGNSEEVLILQDQVKQLRGEIDSLKKKLALASKGRPIEDDEGEDLDNRDSTGLRPAGLVPGVKAANIPACPLKGMPGSLELAPIPAVTGAKTKGAAAPSGKKRGSAASSGPPKPALGFAGAGGLLSNMLAARSASGPPPGGLPGASAAPMAPAAPVISAIEREEQIRKKLGLAKKKPINPTVKMRNIYWTTVPVEKLEGTVWPELSDQNIKFSIKKLEKLFGQDPNANTKTLPNPDDVKRKSLGKFHLVTGKRQQNVGIALSKMRATEREIVSAIISMDETLLTPTHTQLLLTCVPTDDEIELVKQYEANNGDPSKLAREDRFLRALGNVPHLRERLAAVLTMHNFESDYERIEHKTRLVHRACIELDRSEDLKRLLEIVLAIGNYVNGGTPRGAAWGFKLDALAKLDTIKDNTNKHTLMDFIFALLEDNYPDLTNFELPACRMAVEVSLADTMTELNQLASSVRSIKSQLEQPLINKKDRFHKVMVGFEVKASKYVSELQTQFEKVRGEFLRLAKQFAESGAAVEPETFFSKFVKFEIALQHSRRQVADKLEREARARRLAEQRQRMKTLKRLKELEAAGADEGVFAQFAKANAGNAQDIVQGFLQRHRANPSLTRKSLASTKSGGGDTLKKKKKKKKDVKIVTVVGPDGQIIEKRLKRKKKKKAASSVPNARDFDIA